MNHTEVTIVVPVYADWPSLKDCINSLIKFVDKKHKIMLINDDGPQADFMEKKITGTISGQPNIKYYRNPENLGFLKTCNRAVFELDNSSNHILILNSDTKVTAGFLEEMLGVLRINKKIGAVSPRSNNATIATVPLSAVNQKGIDAEESYRIFKRLKKRLPRYVEVPTAHGFCMLVRRSVINKLGLFDEVYGKGYGEENDFSMRIKRAGYISVLSNRSYVFHLEARSFTMKTKSQLLKVNRSILDTRYPEYTQLVQEYLRDALIREEGGRFKRLFKNPKQIPRRFMRIVQG
jgi:GT2 family glycosyltransferase